MFSPERQHQGALLHGRSCRRQGNAVYPRYTVLGFACSLQDWNTVDFWPTPEELLDSYENFRMMEIMGGNRDLTEKKATRRKRRHEKLLP